MWILPFLLVLDASAGEALRRLHGEFEGSAWAQGDAAVEHLVVRSPEELTRFVARIPRGPGNFSYETIDLDLGPRWLLVTLRSDTLMSPPEVVRVTADAQSATAYYRHDPPPAGAPSPAPGTAAYHAVLVKALPAEPQWVRWPTLTEHHGRLDMSGGLGDTLHIDDPAEYEAFVQRLPADDPFRQMDAVDLQAFEIVVALRSDALAPPPEIQRVTGGERPTIQAERPPATQPAPEGQGAFALWVLPALTEGQVAHSAP